MALVLVYDTKIVASGMAFGICGVLVLTSWVDLPWQDLRLIRILGLLIVPGVLAAAALLASLLAVSRVAFADR